MSILTVKPGSGGPGTFGRKTDSWNTALSDLRPEIAFSEGFKCFFLAPFESYLLRQFNASRVLPVVPSPRSAALLFVVVTSATISKSPMAYDTHLLL